MKKYLYLFKNHFINRLDYRQEIATNLIISGLVFSSYALFWHAVFRDHKTIKGFNYEQMITYYLFLNITADIVDSRLGFTMSKNVVTGYISNLLVKPVRIRAWMLSEEIGKIIPMIIIKFTMFNVICLVLFRHFTYSFDHLLLYLVFLPIAFLINGNIYYILGCLSFWVPDIKGLLYGVRRFFYFLSGGYLPLIFFPEVAQQILKLLPFKYAFALPMDLLKNGFDIKTQWQPLILMFIWLIVLTIFAEKFFYYSLKSNESVGI
jgi:ABC-2 type transport system permease protein